MIAIIHNLCIWKMLPDQYVIRSIHVHGNSHDVSQEGRIRFREEPFKVFFAPTFADPKYFSGSQIHDTSRVGVSFVDRKLVYRQHPWTVTAGLQFCHVLFQPAFHDLQVQLANGFPMNPSHTLDRPDGYFESKHRLNPSRRPLCYLCPGMSQWDFFGELLSTIPALVTVANKRKLLCHAIPHRHILQGYTSITV